MHACVSWKIKGLWNTLWLFLFCSEEFLYSAPLCVFTGPDWSQAQQGLLSLLILPSPFPWLWFLWTVGGDSENRIHPFMRVTNSMTRRLATLTEWGRAHSVICMSLNFFTLTFRAQGRRPIASIPAAGLRGRFSGIEFAKHWKIFFHRLQPRPIQIHIFHDDLEANPACLLITFMGSSNPDGILLGHRVGIQRCLCRAPKGLGITVCNLTRMRSRPCTWL